MTPIREAYTFDDVLLVPAASSVVPREVDLGTALARGLAINIPMVSAAMDSVTESAAAICLARHGGIGIIHRNLPPERQAEEVRKVKKFESGVISDPITVTAGTTIREVLELTRKHGISGVPVLDAGKLTGIVTNRDLRFETRFDEPVKSVMTSRERLVTVKEGTSREKVRELLHRHRIEKVLVVDDDFNLKGLVTVKDIQKSVDYPLASKDGQGRLIAGAAVGTGSDTDERVEKLLRAEVDVIVVDTAHGHSDRVIERVRDIKRKHPHLPVIAGNIATAAAARALADAGADAVKVGIGPGSICTTRIVAGVGIPQVTAIADVAQALRGSEVAVIADGGIRYSGDITKALAAGAHSVMIGSLLAGTDESPGSIEIYEGRPYKTYRGMGSLGAMASGSRDRYFQETTREADKLVPEGIEGRVPYKGSMSAIIHQLMGGLRAGMGYTGCRTLEELRTRAEMVRISNAGIRESHVHDVTIVKEAPNYRVGK